MTTTLQSGATAETGRAIGLDRHRVKRMVRLESLVISLFGGVLGIALGGFFGWAARADRLRDADVRTGSALGPDGRIPRAGGEGEVVGVLAALWPARRAAKLNMLDAIKSE